MIGFASTRQTVLESKYSPSSTRRNVEESHVTPINCQRNVCRAARAIVSFAGHSLLDFSIIPREPARIERSSRSIIETELLINRAGAFTHGYGSVLSWIGLLCPSVQLLRIQRIKIVLSPIEALCVQHLSLLAPAPLILHCLLQLIQGLAAALHIYAMRKSIAFECLDICVE